MRVRRAWFVCVFVGVLGSLVWFSLSRGQERPASTGTPVPVPEDARLKTSVSAAPVRDLDKLPLLQKQMYFSAQRGADWLYRVNGNDGRFVYGYVPSLKAVLEGDHFLRQAGAAFALARAANFTGDARYAARARQAVLLLLEDTALEPNRPGVRCTTLPPMLVNRLAAAGLLVLAIHELPAPAEDLLEKSDQLCAFIRGQQRADGSFSDNITPPGAAAKSTAGDPEDAHSYPGEALYGLMRSQKQRPAAWKLDVVRKALAFYRPRWHEHKTLASVPWQTAAYAEAYLLTGEKPFAECVNEMNDWLCELQYLLLDPRRPLWGGGFMGWADGKPVTSPPQVVTAAYAEGLAEACRVARQAGDLQHYQRFREALERSLQFVSRLQYTDANTQHFADWYRPALLGAFHASHQDGNIRLDYTQHAVSALVLYLTHVVE